VYQDRTTNGIQVGVWKRGSSSKHYGGSVRYSSTAGAVFGRGANVSDFALVTTLGPNRGRAEVLVDGVVTATLDLYSATTMYRRVVYAVDFGMSGFHTIEVRVLGTKNPKSTGKRIDVDAFLTLSAYP
jgi:hypothetical protein